MNEELKPEIRHFILCKTYEIHEDQGFSAHNVYDGFSSAEYPLRMELTFILGVYGIPKGKHNVAVEVSQKEGVFATFQFTEVDLPDPKSSVNFLMKTDEFVIPSDGEVLFRVLLDGCDIGTQRVFAFRKDMPV